jgi:hypothetical protein
MTNTTATPTILSDPGFLFWAPLGSDEPDMTVVGSKFTDAWPVAWLPLGATEDGSTFSYEQTVEAIRVAELFDPIKYVQTENAGTLAFNLASFTMTNLKRAYNGGTITVTGSTTTTLTRLDPPDPADVVRAMVGWESLDGTARIIGRQALNSGAVANAFQKAPAYAVIPFNFNLERPAGDTSFSLWGAGVARG